MQLSTHSDKLERYLGKEEVNNISRQMRNWYGPPIAVSGVPGKVFATKGGEFRGRIATGGLASALCVGESFLKRMASPFRRWSREQAGTLNVGSLASLSDLISKMTSGGRREFTFNKTSPGAIIPAATSAWKSGTLPAAGSAAASAPGGTIFTSASTGAISFDNASPLTQWIVASIMVSDQRGAILIYDRLFGVAKTMTSTSAETVTGVPTRYQNTTVGQDNSIGGNFLFFEAGSALAATAHNWTATYTNESGTSGRTLPSLVGNASNVIGRLDHPLATWFAPLASPDTGIASLQDVTISASVASGSIDAVIGHPLCWIPVPLASIGCLFDGVNSSTSLVRVFDNAALAFMEPGRTFNGGTNFTGNITTVRA